MRKRTYLQLQLKRASKIYPTIFIITIVTITSIALMAGLLLRNSLMSEDKQKIQIGLVKESEDTFLEMSLNAMKEIGGLNVTFDFPEMDEAEAQRALKKREISGYLHIPEDYIQNIYYGENNPAIYVTLSSPDGFGTILMEELTNLISEMVIEAQGALYSMRDVAYDYDVDAGINDKVVEMGFSYVEDILGRKNTYEVEQLGIADSISTGGYYICGAMVFFMLLWGISCNKLLIKRDLAMSKVLYSRGIKTTWQVICEYLSFFAVTFVTLLIMGILFGVVVQNNDLGIYELRAAGIFSCIGFIFACIPVIMMITAMQMVMYEMVSGTVNVILLQFLIAIVFGYISGCFYPNYFFPEIVQNLANVLPAGMGFSYMRKCMTDGAVITEFFMMMLYTVAFTALSIFIRKCRMVSDR